jgi:competence protein ComEA
MSKLLKRFLVSFFSLSKSEQKGIVILTILIILLVAANQFLPLFIQHPWVNQAEYLEKVKAFQQKQQELSDSVYLAGRQARGQLDSVEANKILKPFPFNPNGLPDSSWLALGLSEKQLATIKNYEAKGGRFDSKEDFKKIYGISEGEYLVLEPFIEIPKAKQNRKPAAKKADVITESKPSKTIYSTIELNQADSALIAERLKFPSWIATRVVKFRNLLGGFYAVDQLNEVYGMDSLEVEKRKNFIEIDTTQIRKIDLNKATFKELVNHPYISYDLTKEIVEFRQENVKINSTYELVEQEIIPDSLHQKLKHYLIAP